MYRMVDLIEKKKNNNALTKEEIEFVVNGYTKGEIPDYQMSAMLMAVYFCGMDSNELLILTKAMRDSGDVLDLSGIDGVKVDKHSTGGVGDKTSLVLIPIVAACGVPVAKMSGRGLGHTGGTIDKLECFEGFDVNLDAHAFFEQVKRYKMAITGQSGNLAPADKLLYALRDVTGTVNHIALIASSIMSKKLAAGCDAIVLDVTWGSGAFMKTKEQAEQLAKCMVEIGKAAGKETVAVISNMNEPLGYTVGNAVEVQEAIEALKGNGPQDLMEIVFSLAIEMILLAKLATDRKDARRQIDEAIKSGAAFEKLRQLVTIQKGSDTAINNPDELPQAKHRIPLYSKKTGYISKCDALQVGLVSMKLGGGRKSKTDCIDLAVGVTLCKKINDYVKEGDVLAYIHSNYEKNEDILCELESAYEVSDFPTNEEPLIYKIIS
ncbi:pyrimidine-nucleoside phosphorylase [Eubacterium oxidoreducens]|uniref:Pyrimidine-nucleoside phosphorylase n=1 Tax=Eubacterium oxidoreducens TaxID=1732 RepID=A0A1G6ALW0_EUBOX|nr:pyrimidine-nucleoside phosphorylase [Eubacterium oxidoreducens]SDB09123.1 pyrimidine-nucleoside phosphorylase [Eubacterium oxidoreducens]